MTPRPHIATACIVALGILSVAIAAQTAPPQPTQNQKEARMSAHATGPFEVKLTSQQDNIDPTISRMSLEKTLHGDLEGASKGQMLSASTDVKGSAGYVAIERVTGTLRTVAGPRTGSFTLQHSATLDRGAPQLSITVVPDSGTGQLAGLTGKMTINIADGKHSYDFEYTLP